MKARLFFYCVFAMVMSLFLNVASCEYIQRDYQGVIGNLCEVTEDNPGGHCYRALPEGGFPLIFVRDYGTSSVVGKLEPWDDFDTRNFWLNNLFYFIIIFGFLVIRFRRKLDRADKPRL